MTWSYSGDPSRSDLDEVRFLIGDTVESDPQLQDEEINYLLNGYGDSQAAAIAACENLIAHYSRYVDQKTGDIDIKFSQRIANLKERIATIRRQIGILAQPYAGGITKSDRDIDLEDTDLVQPAFEVGGMDHDGPRDTVGQVARREWGDD